MRLFGKHDNDDLARLEQRLRAHRSEPPARFVQSLAHRLRAEKRWFQPKLRYALLAVLTAAVLAAGASAGGLRLAASTADNAVNLVGNLTGSSTAGVKGSSSKGAGANANTPGHDQYKGKCGQPPQKRCKVDVKPNKESVREGASGTTSITFTITLNDQSDGTVYIHYSTANGTATVGDNDYQSQSGTIHFAFGEKKKTITILVNGDMTREDNESFVVNFSSLNNGATISTHDSSVEVTIENDDGCLRNRHDTDGECRVGLDDSRVSVRERDSGMKALTFKVRLKGGTDSDGSVNIAYATSDGSATGSGPNADYVPASGTINIPAGQDSVTITVFVRGDLINEQDEVFYLSISSPDGSAEITGASQATIKINDDDR